MSAPDAHCWRDIASAPRDGTAFLGYWPNAYIKRASPYDDRGEGTGCPLVTYLARYDDEEWWATPDGDVYNEGVVPTHWQPLPPPPGAKP